MNSMLGQPVGSVFPSRPQESLAPSQRMHLILLGVESVPRATSFYEALGWTKSPSGNEGFAKFDLGGYALCLISRSDLARDALAPATEHGGFSGIALVYLAKSADEVPRILAKAASAGGKSSNQPPERLGEWLATSRTPTGICLRRILKRPGFSTMTTGLLWMEKGLTERPDLCLAQ